MTADFLNEKEKKVLELETRKKIYEIVKKYAGSHFREIERKSDLPAGTVKYHLSYLAKQGLIKEDKDGNNIRYFVKGFQPKSKKLMGLLRQKSIRRILVFILTHNNCNHEHLVEFVKLSPSTISWHLKKLENENIIASTKDGRKAAYSLLVDKDEIINLLITYRESFFDTLVDNIVDMWNIT